MSGLAQTVKRLRQQFSWKWSAKLLLSALASASAFCQAPTKSDITDGVTPLVVAPGNPRSVYPLNGFESIDEYAGKVHIAIPLVPIAGRGAPAYTVTTSVLNLSWTVQVESDPQTAPDPAGHEVNFIQRFSGAVWSDGSTKYRAGYGPGMIVSKQSGWDPSFGCNGSAANGVMTQTFTQMIFLEPNGTEHPLLPANGFGVQQNACNIIGSSNGGKPYDRGPWYVAQDESHLRFLSAQGVFNDIADPGFYASGAVYNPNNANGTLYFPDGRQYTIVNGLVTRIIDHNGNTTSFTYGPSSGQNSNLGSVFVSQITDAAGKTYSFTYNDASLPGCQAASSKGATLQCDSIQYAAQGNTPEKIIVHYDQLYKLLRADQVVPAGGLFPGNPIASLLAMNSTELIAQEVVLSEIDYPNGASWKFSYNPYGEIAKVILPTGGTIEYEHGSGLTNGNDPATGVYASGQILDATIPNQPGIDYGIWRPVIYRRLLQRREYSTALPGEGASPRPAGTATRTTIYDPFETASQPFAHPLAPHPIEGVIITSTGNVTVREIDGVSGATTITTHRFHDASTTDSQNTIHGIVSAASPAQVLIAIGDQFLTTRDPFEGKEYHTEICCGASGTSRMVDNAYGLQFEQNLQGGAVSVARACQENTTIADNASISLVASQLFFYDRNIDGTQADSLFRFGNQTDSYEYAFANAQPITDITSDFTLRYCPSAPPGGYARRVRTDYLQDANYLSTSTFLPSLISSTRVLDSNGTSFSEEDYFYDGSNALDPLANYVPIQAAYCGSTSQPYRGNVTALSNGIGADSGTDLFKYDCVGNLTQHQDPKGNMTTFGYGDNFVASPPLGPTFGYRTSIQLPNGAPPITRVYDPDTGRVRQEIDANGLSTSFDYCDPTCDPLNRLVHVMRGVGAGGTITANSAFSYNDVPTTSAGASLSTLKDQFGGDLRHNARTEYDGFGREVRSFNNGVDVIRTEERYDGLGRVFQTCNPQTDGTSSPTDGCTTTVYDALGRALSITHPDGSQVSYEYGAVSDSTGTFRTTKVTDEAGVQRTMEYDSFGRLAGVIEAADTALYTHDVLDDLTDVLQTDLSTGAVQHRHFVYDSRKRLTSSNNPENGLHFFSYDANDNMVTKSDGRFTTCYGNMISGVCDKSGYDSLNRLTHISFSDPNTPSAVYCYDGFSYQPNQGACGTSQATQQWMHRTAAANWNASPNAPPPSISDVSVTTYSYDLGGRLSGSAQSTGGSTFPFVYIYFNDDAVATIQYPSGRAVTTCYDSNGRPIWVDATKVAADCINNAGPSSQAYASVGAYWPQSAVKTVMFGNGITETIAYNNRLQVTGMTAGTPNTNLLGLVLSYAPIPGCGTGNNGNLTAQTISYPASSTEAALNVAQTYCYDSVNRLTTFTDSGLSQINSYDGFGNRWVSNTSMPTVSALTPTLQTAFNQPGQAPNNQLANIGYDASGNQTQVDPFQLTYDAEDHVIQAAAGNPIFLTVAYSYDAEGRRVQRMGTQTTVYVYDGFGKLAAEYGSQNTATGTQYLTEDHLGSVRLVTDASANILHRYDYLPFGETIDAGVNGRSSLYSASMSDGLTIKYTGKERDADTGLDFFGSRYFSGAEGRFTSPDDLFVDQHPENPQTWNLFTYAKNDPLLYIDQDGFQSIKYLRQRAVDVAWEQEMSMVRRTGKGTRNWNAAELRLLENGQRPKGYFGHHIKSVAKYPQFAGDPRNIRFVNREEHLELHGGSWRNPTRGKFMARSLAILDIIQTIVSAYADYKEMKDTGILVSQSPFSYGAKFIEDPEAAAETLDNQYISVDGTTYHVVDGEYLRAFCSDEDCAVDPSKFKGKKFEIVNPDDFAD